MGWKISTVVAMDADLRIFLIFFKIFFPLDQKDRTTGSPNHGHAIYWVKRGRKKKKKKNPKQVTHNAPEVFLFLLRFWQVLRGKKRCVSVGLKRKKLANGWLRWVNIYILTYMQRWEEVHLLEYCQVQFWSAGTSLDWFSIL